MSASYENALYRSLENRHVLITGGASALARNGQAYRAQGARVSFIDIE